MTCDICKDSGFRPSCNGTAPSEGCVCQRRRTLINLARSMVVASSIGESVGYTLVDHRVRKHDEPWYVGGPAFLSSPLSTYDGHAIVTCNWAEFQQVLFTSAVTWVARYLLAKFPESNPGVFSMPDVVRITTDLKIRERNFKSKTESHIDLAQFAVGPGLLMIRMGQSGKNAATGAAVFEVCQEATNNGHKVWLISDVHRPLNLKPESMQDMQDWVTGNKPKRFNLAAPESDPENVDLMALMADSEPDEEPELESEPEDLEEDILSRFPR